MSGGEVTSLYADGGVIGRNPSAVGGTWAWVQVNADGEHVRTGSGIVTPIFHGLDLITNNLTELLAAVLGLESLPTGWVGTVYTDSQVTLYRITRDKTKWAGIPAVLVERTQAARKPLGAYTVVLLGGHPTKAELAAGVRRDGFPCSPHNVWCDKACGVEGRNYLASLAAQPTAGAV